MPGKPITDQQMRVCMSERVFRSQLIAAARAGVSERTRRQVEANPVSPSQRKPNRGRTRRSITKKIASMPKPSC